MAAVLRTDPNTVHKILNLPEKLDAAGSNPDSVKVTLHNDKSETQDFTIENKNLHKGNKWDEYDDPQADVFPNLEIKAEYRRPW